MYRHILVVLDGAQRETWKDLVAEVDRLASGTDTKVTLLAVETVSEAVAEEAVESGDIVSVATLVFAAPAAAFVSGHQPSHRAFDSVREELQWRLEDVARPLQDHGLQTEYAVRFGDVGDVTREYWRTHDADLMVVPIPWRRGLGRLVSGSLANDLLKAGIDRLLLVQVKRSAAHGPSPEGQRGTHSQFSPSN